MYRTVFVRLLNGLKAHKYNKTSTQRELSNANLSWSCANFKNLLPIKPQPITLKFLPISYAFEQCSKELPIMLNIMPITLQLCHSSYTILLITRSAWLSSRLICFNFYQESSCFYPSCQDAVLLFLTYYELHSKLLIMISNKFSMKICNSSQAKLVVV